MSWYIIIIIAILLYLLRQWFRGGKCTNQHDITNQFIIITGSSSGLGKSTAENLLSHGAKVLYACRSEQKAKESMNELSLKDRSNASFLQLNLCSFKSIRQFAESIKANYPPIDILINNAGAIPREYILTEDNIESSLQGNHLGPMLLTLLLLDHFNSSQSKIINVSSRAHKRAKFTIDSIKGLSNEELMKDYFKSFKARTELYGVTKLMNIYFTQYLAEKLSKKYGYVKAVSLHPGFVNTPMTRDTKSRRIKRILLTLLYPLFLFVSKNWEDGIQTHLHLSYMPFEAMTSGAYYKDCSLAAISETAKQTQIRDAVMKWSLDTLKDRVGGFEHPL